MSDDHQRPIGARRARHARPAPHRQSQHASAPSGSLSGDDVRPLENWGLPMVAMIVGAFMALLDSSIVNVAIPTMEHVFGVNTAQVEWVVTIYLLALGVVVPASGWLGDRMGFKRLYLWSLGVFVIGSALSGLSLSLPMLIGARVLQAVGGGMIMPTTMSMVFRLIPRERLGIASGIFGMSMLLAPAIGPTVGGYLVQYVNWRWIFTVNIPIGIFGLVLTTAVLPEFGSRDAGPFDLWGFISSGLGLFALLLALSEGSTWGWHSEGIAWLFFISAVSLLLFVWVELKVARPLLDLRALRYGSFTASLIFTVAMNVALFAGAFFIPVFLQLVRDKGALQTGLILMPGALATGMMMALAGRMYDRIGPKVPVIVGTLILAFGTYLFHSMTLQTSDGMIVLWMAVRGVGMGLAMMPATTAGMSVIPPQMIGRASALSNILMRVSGSFGIAVLTVALNGGIANQSAAIAARMTVGSPAAMALGAVAHASPTVLRSDLYSAYQYVQGLAFVRSLDNIFVALAIIGVVSIVPAAFLRKHLTAGESHAAGPAIE